jgi:hypothetical protein
MSEDKRGVEGRFQQRMRHGVAVSDTDIDQPADVAERPARELPLDAESPRSR